MRLSCWKALENNKKDPSEPTERMTQQTANKPIKQKIFFENLDGLRFLAFFGVFVNHATFSTHEHILQNPVFKWIDYLGDYGALGVNFFFVLSGFLITYLLLHEKKQHPQGKINLRYFYIRRTLRIWPLYLGVTFFGFVIFPLLKSFFGEIPSETANPWLFLTFLSNFNTILNGTPDASMLAVLWSVAIEEQFYLFWPLILWFPKAKQYLPIIVSIIIASLVFRAMHITEKHVLYVHTLSVISDMCIGGIGAWLSYHRKGFIAYIKHLSKSSIAGIYALFVLALIAHNLLTVIPTYLIFDRLILSFFFLFIVLEQNYAANSLFKMSWFKRVSHWGKYTYGLYCLHQIGILITLIISRKIGFNTSIYAALLLEPCIALALSLIISWFSYHFFEAYFLTLKKKFISY